MTVKQFSFLFRKRCRGGCWWQVLRRKPLTRSVSSLGILLSRGRMKHSWDHFPPPLSQPQGCNIRESQNPPGDRHLNEKERWRWLREHRRRRKLIIWWKSHKLLSGVIIDVILIKLEVFFGGGWFRVKQASGIETPDVLYRDRLHVGWPGIWILTTDIETPYSCCRRWKSRRVSPTTHKLFY